MPSTAASSAPLHLSKSADDAKLRAAVDRLETLEQLVQRSCGCSIPGSIQGEVGEDFERPDLVEDVPAHSRGVGLGAL